MATRYQPNRAGIAELGRSQQVQDALRLMAEKVRINAERIAPVRTGHYAYNHPNPKVPGDKGGFTLKVGVERGRARATVTNSTAYARFLEFGTSKMRKQRIMGRALASLRR